MTLYGWTLAQIAHAKQRHKRMTGDDLTPDLAGVIQLTNWWVAHRWPAPLSVQLVYHAVTSECATRWAAEAMHAAALECAHGGTGVRKASADKDARIAEVQRWTSVCAEPSESGGFVAYGDFVALQRDFNQAEQSRMTNAKLLDEALRKLAERDEEHDSLVNMLNMEVERLTNKLAKQQVFIKTCVENPESGDQFFKAELLVEAWQCKELNNLIAKAKEEGRKEAVPDSCYVTRGFAYNPSTGLHTPSVTVFFQAGHGGKEATWIERDTFYERINVAPKPQGETK